MHGIEHILTNPRTREAKEMARLAMLFLRPKVRGESGEVG